MTLKGTPDQARTRLLLALWELGAAEHEIKKGELTKKVVRKGEKSGDYQPLLNELQDKGAIALSPHGRSVKVTIQSDNVKQLLVGILLNSDFEFDAQIGQGAANALLALVRQMGQVTERSIAPVAVTNGHGKTAIASYEEFKTTALQVYDTLNHDFNMDNLVPIYRIRREIGDRVSRSQFNEWMLELQSNAVLQLIGGEMPSLTPDKAEDSIETKLGGMRYYSKRL